MSNQRIKQRIAYLVEHGGLVDDPLDEIRQRVRVLSIMLAATLAILLVDVAVDLMR